MISIHLSQVNLSHLFKAHAAAIKLATLKGMYMEALLSVEQVNAYFGAKQVLFEVDLQVAAGQKVAIVGESGSGKTVLAQGIMRLNPDVSLNGTIAYQGQDLLGLSEKQLAKIRGREIGMVFQEPMTALNPVFTVGNQIAEVYGQHLGLTRTQAWQAAIDILKETGIQDAAAKVKAYPFQLSGGQRQRAMIAMAVAASPKLLIADEPTTALDVAVQAQIVQLLQRLQAEYHMALLYISHDLRLVERFADEVVVMQQGHVVEHAPTQILFSAAQHPYTQELLNAKPENMCNPEVDQTQTVLAIENVAVEVKQAASWFQTKKIHLLEPVSLRLHRGETMGIVGESGSGKTTLAKALMRLIPASGKVVIADKDWLALSINELTPERHHMQMVFQDPFSAFNPRMTMEQALSEPLLIQKIALSEAEREQRLLQTLDDVGLPHDSLKRYPHEFSGGQRQRLAIARALVVRPQVLILDEPTSALDVRLQKHILRLLAKLQQQYGLSMLIISHDLDVIASLSQRMLVLQQGKVVEQGEVAAIFAAPNHPYTQNLLQHR